MPDLDDQVRAWAAEVAELAPPAVTRAEVDAVIAGGTVPGIGHRHRASRLVAVVAAVVLVAVGLAVVLAVSDDPQDRVRAGTTTTSTPTPGPGDAAGWTDLGDAPLSARAHPGVHWTGAEVLVLGGTSALPCPDEARCVPREALADGAAYDLSTGTWRPIEAPFGLDGWEPSAVLDGRLYLLAHDPTTATTEGGPGQVWMLRYDPANDTWGRFPAPTNPDGATLVVDGDRLVAYPTSHEGGHDHPDQAYDPKAGEWKDLPRDPLAPSFDRTLVAADGKLFLFAHALVPNPGADGPSLVEAAVLDRGVWTELPPSEAIGFGGVATDDVIVNPERGSADGGEVGNWGRSYPNRWMFDAGAGEWMDVPERPVPRVDGPIDGSVAGSGLVVAEDAVLDVRAHTWSPLDAPRELDRREAGRAWAGDRLVVFGGATVDDDGRGELHRDLWQWVPAAG